MSDFIQFNEGTDYIAASGWPQVVWFPLSIDPVGVLNAQTSLPNVSEITGTGYSRISQNCPYGASGVLAFSTMIWTTGSAVDWPHNVCSIIAATKNNNTGVALCAWNLQPGGAPRDMSLPNTTEEVTPTYVG